MSGFTPLPMNLLLVEDEDEFRQLAAQWLSKRGHTVLGPGTARRSSRSWNAGDFDVVVGDMNMPRDFGPGSSKKERMKSSSSGDGRSSSSPGRRRWRTPSRR